MHGLIEVLITFVVNIFFYSVRIQYIQACEFLDFYLGAASFKLKIW